MKSSPCIGIIEEGEPSGPSREIDGRREPRTPLFLYIIIQYTQRLIARC